MWALFGVFFHAGILQKCEKQEMETDVSSGVDR